MKYVLIAILSLWFASVKSQGALTLPFSGSKICLDNIQSIGNTSLTPRNLVVKDFDGDGFVDVLVADVPSGKVIIYNNNNGTFIPNQVLTVIGFSQFSSIDAGRMDGDGLPDIVVTDSLFKISIFKNTSTGPGNFSFSPNPNYIINVPVSCKSNPSYVKAVSLNNDTYDDIVLAVPPNSGPGLKIVAFRNNFGAVMTFSFIQDYIKPAFASTATQTFAPVCPVPALSINTPFMDMSFGDFSGDGYKDAFITYTEQRDSVLFLRNTCTTIGGPLTFATLPTRSPGFLQTWEVQFGNCELADTDGDMLDDGVCLVSAVSGDLTVNGLVSVQAFNIGQPNPNLFNPVFTSSPVATFWYKDFKIADIDNDNVKDLILMNNSELSVYFGNPPPGLPFSTASVFSVPNVNVAELAIGNFDQNTLPDILYKPWGSSGVTKVIPNFHYSITAVPNNSPIPICSGNTATASLIVIPPITMPHNVQWFLTGTPPLNTGATGPVFSTTNTGVFFPVLNIPFPYTNSVTCSIENYPKDSIRIVSAPSPIFSISPSSSTLCPGNVASLAVLPQTPGSYSYTWATVSNSAASNVSVFPAGTAGSYSVYGIDLTTNCTASQSAVVDFYTVNIGTIIPSKQKVCRGDSTVLSISGQTFTWSTGSNNSSIYVSPVVDTQYGVTVSDSHGCQSTQSVTILVDLLCDFKVYNIVTPNGDNSNDTWIIENINKYPNNTVQIYNRWGKRVYFTNGYNNESNSWPGPDSKNLTPSTYFYLIDLGDGSPKIKGWLELIN